MNLRAIIDEIADQADDFLAGASSRAQAQAGVEEMITAGYGSLTPPERREVVVGVMRILDEEGFFEGGAPAAGSAEDEDNDDRPLP